MQAMAVTGWLSHAMLCDPKLPDIRELVPRRLTGRFEANSIDGWKPIWPTNSVRHAANFRLRQPSKTLASSGPASNSMALWKACAIRGMNPVQKVKSEHEMLPGTQLPLRPMAASRLRPSAGLLPERKRRGIAFPSAHVRSGGCQRCSIDSRYKISYARLLDKRISMSTIVPPSNTSKTFAINKGGRIFFRLGMLQPFPPLQLIGSKPSPPAEWGRHQPQVGWSNLRHYIDSSTPSWFRSSTL